MPMDLLAMRRHGWLAWLEIQDLRGLMERLARMVLKAILVLLALTVHLALMVLRVILGLLALTVRRRMR